MIDKPFSEHNSNLLCTSCRSEALQCVGLGVRLNPDKAIQMDLLCDQCGVRSHLSVSHSARHNVVVCHYQNPED